MGILTSATPVHEAWSGLATNGGRVFVLDVIFGRYDLDRGLEQGFKVLRVRKWAASHHVDDLLSRVVPGLFAVDMSRVHWG